MYEICRSADTLLGLNRSQTHTRTKQGYIRN